MDIKGVDEWPYFVGDSDSSVDVSCWHVKYRSADIYQFSDTCT